MKNLQLTETQRKAISHLEQQCSTILQAKPGSGKTLIVLETIAREKPSHVIYCSTPQIAYKGVPAEIKKFGYKFNVYSMEDAKSRAETIRRWRAKGGLLLVSIQLLHKLPVCEVPYTTWFVLDESTLTKRPGGVWSETAQQIAARCCKRILMTGTFRSNELHHVYKQAAIAIGDPQEVVSRLGRFETWKRKHFYVQRVQRGRLILEKLLPKPNAVENVINELAGLLIVVEADETTAARYPKIVEKQIVVRPQLPPSWRFNNPNTTTTVTKLQQAAFGIVYLDQVNENNKGRKTIRLHSEKLGVIRNLLEKHKRVVYVYAFDHEKEAVAKIARSLGLKTRTAKANSKGWIESWNAGKIDVLLLHPRSAGHGVNIQFGGNVMVWGIPTPDYEAYTQTVARLARPGQPETEVLVYEIVADGTIDTIMKHARDSRVLGEKELLEKWRAESKTQPASALNQPMREEVKHEH